MTRKTNVSRVTSNTRAEDGQQNAHFILTRSEAHQYRHRQYRSKSTRCMKQYSIYPQFEDIEIQELPRHDAIRSITISKETRADGSVVRRKETVLVSGQTLVEEKEVMSPSSPGTRIISTSPQFDILPLYHNQSSGRDPSCSVELSKQKISKDDVTASRMPCRIAAIVLMLLLMFQAKIFYMIVSGNDFHPFYPVLRKFPWPI